MSTLTKARRVNQAEAVDCIRQGEPFLASALSGGVNDGRLGDLPTEQRKEFIKAEPDMVYVVRSYETPIGWLTTDGVWTIPALRYSRTTSSHQGMLRLAVRAGGRYDKAERRAVPVGFYESRYGW